MIVIVATAGAVDVFLVPVIMVVSVTMAVPVIVPMGVTVPMIVIVVVVVTMVVGMPMGMIVIAAAVRPMHVLRGRALGPALLSTGESRRDGGIAALVRMPVIVAMVVPDRRTMPVGAAFGIERRFDETDRRPTHLLDHLDQDVVVADPQDTRQDLGRRVTVAQMPGQTREGQRLGEAEFDQLFRSGGDGDQPSVLELEGIAVRQGGRLGEIDEKFDPLLTHHHAAPTSTLVEVENDAIASEGRRPGAGGKNLGGTDHLRTSSGAGRAERRTVPRNDGERKASNAGDGGGERKPPRTLGRQSSSPPEAIIASSARRSEIFRRSDADFN